MADPTAALEMARRQRRRQLEALADFIRIPSVSSDPRRRRDIRRAAAWLTERLGALGVRATMLGPHWAPVVHGRARMRPGAPTLLVYGHYDVVSAEPAAEWRQPPFAATVSGGDIHGRGACDNKGPLLCHLAALEAWTRAAGGPPVNLTLLLEGQEEVGSAAVLSMLRRRRPGLRADAAVVSDTRMRSGGRPTLIRGLRGTLAVDLVVRGPPRDLHSGQFGGAVRNPAHVLAELVASLHDRRGRVALPGFYARVRKRRAQPPESYPDDHEVLGEGGVRRGFGEHGFSAYERTTLRPSLDVNGLTSGHTGPGAKSIVPAEARARLSFRLVPDQRPEEVAGQLRRYLASRTPAEVRVSVSFAKPTPPVTTERRDFATAAAVRALTASFGQQPAMIRSGGSIPVVGALAELGMPVVLMGFASPDEGMHAPNERFSLASFARGTDTCVRFLAELAKTPPGRRPRARVATLA